MSINRIARQVLVKSSAWRLPRLLNRRRLAILMYHGITSSDVPNWTQVSLDQFERQMDHVRKYYTPIGLGEAVTRLRQGEALPNWPVAVTFDDGFENNHTEAYPVLKRYQIPATVFLAVSFVEGHPIYGDLLWTDFVYALLVSSPVTRLDLTDLSLGVYNLPDEWSRYEAKGTICAALKTYPVKKKREVIEAMASRLGTAIDRSMFAPFRSMSWRQAAQMCAEGLVEIGSHGMTHEILSRLPPDAAKAEIIDSGQVIEGKIGRPVRFFAYPNGKPADFTAETAAVVAKHYQACLTTVDGFNHPQCDPFELRRLAVGRDTSFDTFVLLLSSTVYRLNKFALRGRNH